ALAGVALLLRPRPAPAVVPPMRFVLSSTDSATPARSFPWPAATSPDGGTVVYSVTPVGENGHLAGRLYFQRTDQLLAREIPGTIGAAQPYFSPDGQWVGFEQQGKERKVRLDGSAPVTIANAGAFNGSNWTVNNEILLGNWGPFKGLSRVSAAGGTPVALTTVDTARGEREHLWPLGTPDGRHAVFIIYHGGLASAELGLASLKDGTVTRLGVKAIRPLAVLDGWLVYLKADGSVMAVRLDVGAGKVVGSPIPVHDPVAVVPGLNGNSEIYISRGGALVTSIGSATATIAWVAPGGAPSPIRTKTETGAWATLRLSPDQHRIAVLAGTSGQSDVWIEDLSLGTFSRLTTVNTVISVGWTPDGSDVLYFSTSESGTTLWRQRASGGSPAEKLIELPYSAGGAIMSPDGKSVLLSVIPGDVWSLQRLVLDSTPAVHDYLSSRGSLHAPEFSPDGKWVAVVNDESGQDEVYIRSYPDPLTRLQVSAGGGAAPMWSADGSRLYYLSGPTLIEARLATRPALTVLGRDTVMASFPSAGTDAQWSAASYQPTRDGRRFLTTVPERNDYRLVISPNWITEFRRRVAESGGAR
ncbi:MAG TPA: hypothetical protein VNH46_12965, partial [Gemmatimonadales bacterium]|nr:hypothetical protein [Gemmatimonadales bacterium]